eukprot:TRINITY_DN15078_c0_g1_i1.p1 TRINITY_DN15078_c0_g1~~TRINITY_DN15078_c0_g1_i1.p1  ORF type:complete len:1061 (+),score=318.97 TRINITY_DN15078_c0_g1_i1:168-3350(+)
MAESVCVGVRVRPFNAREIGLNAELCIEMAGPVTGIKAADGKVTRFTFDESFWSHDQFYNDDAGYSNALPGSNYADQRYVFEVFGKRVLDNAWEGFHCCLFAYGQTGAGKSYSMVGYGANKGIVPISCEEIFTRIEANDKPGKKYEVTVSMIEIYNEAVQDLLILPEDRPKKGLEIRESKLLGIYIDGVVKRPVDTYPAIEAVIDEATSHRTVGSTLMNATSSRAHTVQTIEFKQVEQIMGKEQVKISMVNLVDLAGSEKAGQTGASGDRLKEGCAINSSLTALGNVIEKLAERSSAKGKKKDQIIIPYRNSKLTRLLQNALGGSSKTIMICALSPASSNFDETLSTLRYADRAKKIKNNAAVNENPQDKLLRELREENEKLKQMMEQSQQGGGGGEALDAGALKAMREKETEIQDMEAALQDMQKSFADKLAEAKRKDVDMELRKRGSVLGAGARNTPYIANLNEDSMLSAKITFVFKDREICRIGNPSKSDSDSGEDEVSRSSSDSKSDDSEDSDDSDDDSEDDDEEGFMLQYTLMSPGVRMSHCLIVNVDGHCVLNPGDDKAADCTFINGRPLRQLLPEKCEEDAESEGESQGSEESDAESTEEEDNTDDAKDDEEGSDTEATKSPAEGKADDDEQADGPGNDDEKAGDDDGDAAEGKASDKDAQDDDDRQEDEKGSDDAEKDEPEENKAQEQALNKLMTAMSTKRSLQLLQRRIKHAEDNGVRQDEIARARDIQEEMEVEKRKRVRRKQLQKTGVSLNHCDRVAIAKNLFVFVDPLQGAAAVLIMSGVVSYAVAKKELREAMLASSRMQNIKTDGHFGGLLSTGNSPDGRSRGLPMGDGLLFDDSSSSDGDMVCARYSSHSPTHCRNIGERSESDPTTSKDELLKQLAEKDKEIMELRSAAMSGADTLARSQNPEIASLRRQLQEAAEAMERAGVAVPKTLEQLEDQIAKAAIDDKKKENEVAMKSAKGMRAKIEAGFNSASASLGSIELVVSRFDHKVSSFKLRAESFDSDRLLYRAKKSKYRFKNDVQEGIWEMQNLAMAAEELVSHLPLPRVQ